MTKPVQTRQQQEVERVLHQLATVGGKLTADEDIVFEGKKLILPETMTLSEAYKFLHRKAEEEQKEVSYSHTYLYRPWDGARATGNAIRKAFGGLTQEKTIVKTLFGTEEYPPELITIPVSATETEQVPWGTLALPHLPGLLMELGQSRHAEYGNVFFLSAQGPKKYRHHVQGIFALIEEELKTNSLYRGKAFDGQSMPSFLDLTGVDPRKVIYSDETTAQLEANVWSLLRYSDQMLELGVPLKRAVLLEGPYGTGKTLAAYLTAQVAEENGWSFLLCRPGRDSFEEVMATARLYQPAVVFFEDVDVVSGVDNNVHKLLDTFDGIQSKGTKIIIAVTTNFVEKIHKAMMRPGRLDAVIHIGHLDAAGIMRLVQAVVPEEMLSPDIDWTQVAASMAGYLPTFVREASDRAVRYNVARNKGTGTVLDTEDFVLAAQGLKRQFELMEEAKDEAVKDPLSVSMGRMVEASLEGMKLVHLRHEDGYQLTKRKGGK